MPGAAAPGKPRAAQRIRERRRARQMENEEATVALLRIGSFLGVVLALIFGLDATITAGLRRMPVSLYGVTNRIMAGSINAQIVIAGSSRAASHYDPRIIQRATGYTAFNLGRNGAQTDMQLAVLKTYLKHNKTPSIIIFNLDAFTFQTTREIYNAAQYVPYLDEEELYQPLKKINGNMWKSRYLPLYGYIAEDMSFAWIRGLVALLPVQQRETLFDGFDPRDAKWTGEFDSFKRQKSKAIHWDIEPEAIRLMTNLADICRARSIPLIWIYSPEYSEMQRITANRKEIFAEFAKIANSHNIPIVDYSNWEHASNTEYFTNSQHLNAHGARAFSIDVARKLGTYIGARAAIRQTDRSPLARAASK